MFHWHFLLSASNHRTHCQLRLYVKWHWSYPRLLYVCLCRHSKRLGSRLNAAASLWPRWYQCKGWWVCALSKKCSFWIWILESRGGAFVAVCESVCVLNSRQACLSKQNKRWPLTVHSSSLLLFIPTVLDVRSPSTGEEVDLTGNLLHFFLCCPLFFSHIYTPLSPLGIPLSVFPLAFVPSLVGSLHPSWRYWFR